MKYVYAILCSLLITLTANAQATHQYFFNGSFNELSSAGPALTELISCSATSGAFDTSTIMTTDGPCGSGPQSIFHFNAGGGVNYSNGSVTGTYTIHMFFEFDANTGYRRIIDFLNSTTDVGLYILNGSLNFYPNGNVGTLNFFNTGIYYLVTLVRNGATNRITVYVNGTPFSTYTDNAGDYALASTSVPVILFEDNTSGPAQCEVSAGRIKYFSIKPDTSTAAEVATTYTTICSIIALPVRLISFNGSAQPIGNILTWEMAIGDQESFSVDRSNDAREWKNIGSIKANSSGINNYTFTDAQPLTGTGYYRLRIKEVSGKYTYSNTIAIRQTPVGDDVLVLENNPASRNIGVRLHKGVGTNGELRLMNIEGQVLWHATISEASATIPIAGIPDGIYYVVYSDGATRAYKKVMVQN